MSDERNGHGHLILVADDDEDILMLVAFRLRRAGHEVITAADGDQALELLRHHSPDLLILDVRMPKVTGIDVVRALRESEPTRRVPVILLSASVQDDSVQVGFEAGADEYIKKPFSPHDLVARVDAMLAAHTAGPAR